MRTKNTKEKKNSTPAVEQREPTDGELRAIEKDHATEATEEEVGTVGIPLTSASVASTPVDVARLGLNQIAYIRRSIVDDQPVWSIHSAAGHPLGAALTFEQAWGAVVQNELQPMYVN